MLFLLACAEMTGGMSVEDGASNGPYSGGTSGERGDLTFWEPNIYPVDEAGWSLGFEAPVAVGSTIDVAVMDPDGYTLFGDEDDADDQLFVELVDVAISDGGVFELAWSWSFTKLRAKKAGTAELTMELSNGAYDTLQLTAVEADGAELFVLEHDYDLVEVVADRGFSLRPLSTVRVGAQPLAGDTPLIGYDLLSWSEGQLLSGARDSERVNTRRLQALGTSGAATVTTDIGGTVELGTLDADDPVELAVYADEADAEPVERLEGSTTSLLYVAGSDAQGRWVLGSNDDYSSSWATVVDGDVDLLDSKRTWGRWVLYACEGSGRVELGWLGTTLQLPIEVDADEAHVDCS